MVEAICPTQDSLQSPIGSAYCDVSAIVEQTSCVLYRLWSNTFVWEFLAHVGSNERYRAQAFATFFLRNRPQLELIRRLVERRPLSDKLRVAVWAAAPV